MIRWKWGNEITLGMDEAGKGPSVVLLPALSSISTRQEMLPLFDRLSSQFRVSTVDWPGFGEVARPREDWSPDLLSALLDWFLSEIALPPHAIVAPGHASTYALHHAARGPGTVNRLAAHGDLATNQRLVRIVRDMGFEPATPAEARKMLGLPR
jgi:pimeloyl-ACP methyl ester carboxylesterase